MSGRPAPAGAPQPCGRLISSHPNAEAACPATASYTRSDDTYVLERPPARGELHQRRIVLRGLMIGHLRPHVRQGEPAEGGLGGPALGAVDEAAFRRRLKPSKPGTSTLSNAILPSLDGTERSPPVRALVYNGANLKSAAMPTPGRGQDHGAGTRGPPRIRGQESPSASRETKQDSSWPSTRSTTAYSRRTDEEPTRSSLIAKHLRSERKLKHNDPPRHPGGGRSLPVAPHRGRPHGR